MNITDVTIIPHLVSVWLLLRLCPVFINRGPVPYFVIFAYLSLVHKRYVKAFQNRLESAKERQSSYQRVLADSEILRWLTYVIEKLWPVCIEEYASKRILQPIVNCFLGKHKPSTSKKALVQCLCLGSNPPMITELNVFRNSDDNERLVIEVWINFFAKDHMRSIVAVKLQDRLGLGMWVKLAMTNLYVDGKDELLSVTLKKLPVLVRFLANFVASSCMKSGVS